MSAHKPRCPACRCRIVELDDRVAVCALGHRWWTSWALACKIMDALPGARVKP